MSEFGHRLTLDRIRDGDRIDLTADSAECAAIAERLGLAALERLDAHAVLRRDGVRVRASGRLKAALEQRCVATGELLPVHVDEAFDVQFVFGSGVTSTQRSLFEQAATRWEGVITADLANAAVNKSANLCGQNEPAYNGTVDDVVIYANVGPRDGAGGDAEGDAEGGEQLGLWEVERRLFADNQSAREVLDQ